MELALRPYVTAGVIVAGAGLIAAAPIGLPSLQIQTRAVQLASVDDLGDPASAASLTDQEYPLASWADVYSDTTSNLQSLDAQIAADPYPVLSAIDANLTDYANELASAAQTSSSNLTTTLQDLSTVLSNAVTDLQSGDFYDAETSIQQFLITEPESVFRPFESAYFDITQSIVNNLDNVLTPGGLAYANTTSDFTSLFSVPEWFTDLEQASLYGPNAAEYAMAGVTQDVLTAWQSGDYSLALSDISNAGSTILDAYLNGYQVDGSPVTGPTPDLTDAAALRIGLDPAEGALNGGRESVLSAKEIIASDISPLREAQGPIADATSAASVGADAHTLAGDLGTLLSPDTALGDIVTAFDPNAIADITSLLSGDLAPNASGWVVDFLALF